MINGLNSIRKERASLERDRVVMMTMLEDAAVADMFETAEDTDFFEGVSTNEIEDLIAKIPESDEEDVQVDRILAADINGLDVDGILGIPSDEEHVHISEIELD